MNKYFENINILDQLVPNTAQLVTNVYQNSITTVYVIKDKYF